jgi:hypothetical protein
MRYPERETKIRTKAGAKKPHWPLLEILKRPDAAPLKSVEVTIAERRLQERPKTALGAALPASVELALPALCEMLRFAIGREATYPRIADLRHRLENIEKSARLLMREMVDQRIAPFLCDANGPIENQGEVYCGLRDIAARATRERERIPRKRGRHRFYPETATGPSPRDLCALMISVACHQATGKWPAKNAVMAQQSCEELWRAAGGRRVWWTTRLDRCRH